jgi:hypothetical protein
MQTDDEVRAWLQRVFRDVFHDTYPLPDGVVLDPRYAMSLGFIAGAAHEALQAVAEDRQLLTNALFERLLDAELDRAAAVARLLVKEGAGAGEVAQGILCLKYARDTVPK